jgi:hypothetical protein
VSDGNKANRTEIGSNKKTIGIIRAISAFPALRNMAFLASTLLSLIKEVKTGTSGVPRSRAIIIELAKRRAA